jgi:hypothetical protein
MIAIMKYQNIFKDKTFISNLTKVYKELILIKNAQVYFC